MREELAREQSRLAKAQAELTAARSIGGFAITTDATRAVARAEAALAEADAQAVDDLIAKRMGQDVPERRSRRDLEADLADARSALDAASGARRSLEQRVRDAEGNVQIAQGRVSAAIRDLLETAPEVAGLLDEIKTAERRLIELYAALHEVGGIVEIKTHNDAPLVARPRRTHLPDWDLLPPAAPDSEVVAAWRDALRRLQDDPNAPLPGGTAPTSKAKGRLFKAA